MELHSAIQTLPACQKCRKKRRKCDLSLPACRQCLKFGGECVFFDHVLGREITRQHVAQLLERVAQLEGSETEGVTEGQERGIPEGNIYFSRRGRQHFLGGSSALATAASVLATTDMDLLPAPEQRGAAPAPFPDIPLHPDFAMYLVDTYFDTVHQLFPIFSRDLIMSDMARFDLDRPAFRIYLICSIACAASRPQSFVHLVDSFYNQCKLLMPKATGTISIATLQNVIGLAILCMYRPSLGNIWQLLGFAGRLCGEFNLHETTPPTLYSTLYLLESFLGVTLGRPTVLTPPKSPEGNYMVHATDMASRMRKNLRKKEATTLWGYEAWIHDVAFPEPDLRHGMTDYQRKFLHTMYHDVMLTLLLPAEANDPTPPTALEALRSFVTSLYDNFRDNMVLDYYCVERLYAAITILGESNDGMLRDVFTMMEFAASRYPGIRELRDSLRLHFEGPTNGIKSEP